jgi:hypothetical protein
MSTGTLLLTCLLWSASALPPEIVPWNHKTMQIPIQINPERRSEIRELLLFVSTDQGVTWNQEGRAKPTDEAFTFYAPQDGVYWFAICTVFQNGQREPSDLKQVQQPMKVLIDSTMPVLRIKSAERNGDEISVTYEAQDANADLNTMRLEYRPASDPNAPWIAIPMQGAVLAGTARFRLTMNGPIAVRMSIEDLAKNKAQAQTVIGTGDIPANGGIAGAVAPMPVPPNTTPGGSTNSLPPAPITNNGPPLTMLPDLPPPNNPGVNAPPNNPAPYVPPAGNQPSVQPVTRNDSPAQDRMPNLGSNMPTIASSQPIPQREPAPSYGNEQANYHGTGMSAVASNTHPAAPPRSELKDTRLINSTEISMAYDVLKVGASGLRSVKLYMTQNDGQTWQECAEDKSMRSSITAQLPGEGVYGFRLVLESGAGLSKGPPMAGDQPEVRVEVDLTPPLVELYQLAPDPNSGNGVILRWKAEDKNLAPNPITLEWSEGLEGPWQPIATAIANSGTFGWKMPAKMPVRVYLRVIARDLAGNIGEARTSTPQLIDMTRPEGHLKGIVGTRVMERP